METGSWWPDGDISADRIPLAALAHQNVHELKCPLPRSDAGPRIVTGVPVWSERLGLYGICDAVEVSASSVLPIEHKIGPYHPGGPADVQAAAQALSLAEMLNIDVPAACVFSHADRRRHRVAVTLALNSRIEELTAAIRMALETPQLPEAVHGPRCRRCSLRHDCLPNLASAATAASDPFAVSSAESPDD